MYPKGGWHFGEKFPPMNIYSRDRFGIIRKATHFNAQKIKEWAGVHDISFSKPDLMMLAKSCPIFKTQDWKQNLTHFICASLPLFYRQTSHLQNFFANPRREFKSDWCYIQILSLSSAGKWMCFVGIFSNGWNLSYSFDTQYFYLLTKLCRVEEEVYFYRKPICKKKIGSTRTRSNPISEGIRPCGRNRYN